MRWSPDSSIWSSTATPGFSAPVAEGVTGRPQHRSTWGGAVFVHDFVVVHRPFGELLGQLPFLLETDLASLVHQVWRAGATGVDEDTSPTVIIGSARERIDSIVYPVAWSDPRSIAVPGLEADLELSAIDRSSCDLHLLGRCTAGDEVFPAATARQSRREAVHAVRSLLEQLKFLLETPPLLRPVSSGAH